MVNRENEENLNDLVPTAFGCPRCGERRIDRLALTEDMDVDCGTCGLHYTLPGGKEPDEEQG